jgi:hypothetical protein
MDTNPYESDSKSLRLRGGKPLSLLIYILSAGSLIYIVLMIFASPYVEDFVCHAAALVRGRFVRHVYSPADYGIAWQLFGYSCLGLLIGVFAIVLRKVFQKA